MSSPDEYLHLMDLHLRALFVHDENDAMVRVNVAEEIAAPRFFLGRTPTGVVVRFGAGLPREIADRLRELTESETLDLQTKDPIHARKYIEILSELSPVTAVNHEQAFAFPDDGETHGASDVVDITEDNIELLHGGFEDWLADVPIAQPFVAVVRDGRAVSLAASVRITPRAHECGIETLPAHRGRGLAAMAARAWAHRVRKVGVTPLYSTMWDNVSSQRLAAKIGCIRFGSDFYVT